MAILLRDSPPGCEGNADLQTYAASNPQFNFDPSKYLDSDAMKFPGTAGRRSRPELGDGCHGLAAIAATPQKVLDQYNQGVASTYYNNAFTQAQNEFQTNDSECDAGELIRL